MKPSKTTELTSYGSGNDVLYVHSSDDIKNLYTGDNAIDSHSGYDVKDSYIDVEPVKDSFNGMDDVKDSHNDNKEDFDTEASLHKFGEQSLIW